MRDDPASPGPSALTLNTNIFLGNPSTFNVAMLNCSDVCAIADRAQPSRQQIMILFIGNWFLVQIYEDFLKHRQKTPKIFLKHRQLHLRNSQINLVFRSICTNFVPKFEK
jgi:putative heme degradation protein